MIDRDSPEARLSETILSTLVPFRFLKKGSRDSLLDAGSIRVFNPGDTVIAQGDTGDDSIHILLSGSVETVDHQRRPNFRINVIAAGNYFGERRAIFGNPRTHEARALTQCACLVIPGERFRELLSESRAFAQSFGSAFREGQGIFAAFERFTAETLRATALGHVELRKFVDLYVALQPALHQHAADEGKIDFGALKYAMKRLPENVTRTFVFLLTDDLPVVYASPERLFPFVPTESRHRFVYEMLSGKDMVLIRSGVSDLMDFITCLCAFAVEAKKIRYRINHPDLVMALNAHAAEPAERREPPVDFLAKLPFSSAEREAMLGLWGDRAPERLREITFHRQAYSLDIRKQTNNYNSRLSEVWTRQVGEAAGELLGMGPSELPPDFRVHVVSSNTHSVSNCLNPFFAERASDIFKWAEETGRRSSGWSDPYDELYSLARGYLDSFPDRKEELRETERKWGIMRLPETVTTGIQVQLVDTERVAQRPIDPGVTIPKCGKRSMIVNIDYAFGEQAEDIMRSLLMLFGSNVASINVLGKAGSLVGSRGDVLIPTAFIEQRDDLFIPLPDHVPGGAARVAASLPGKRVHSGPMLTVGGTLLQNRMMLNFYRQIWGCVGIEMEGIYYNRAIVESAELGVLRHDAIRRFFYYVSDLPLRTDQNLSESLLPTEGIPPLYAITREVLSGVFSADCAPRRRKEDRARR